MDNIVRDTLINKSTLMSWVSEVLVGLRDADGKLDDYWYNTQYVWTAGHEYVALDGLTHRPHKEYSGALVFIPSFFRIGLIEEGDELLTGRFPKEYWESLGSDLHFKDFKEIDDRSFCCKGKLSDLMEAIQSRVRFLQSMHYR